ncbi:hypothetical protein [Lentzea sp. NPDC092896]|uniref:hypothetical protein n=1 Tax=Lentzea sp. NPDC092896 TaxID=3364127 RepID=UPI00381C2B36
MQTTTAKMRIVGAEAREINSHVTVYVKPGQNWSEVQSMNECDHGCKLHVRSQGGVREYQLWHSVAYGCLLGRDESTRAVPVSVVMSV